MSEGEVYIYRCTVKTNHIAYFLKILDNHTVTNFLYLPRTGRLLSHLQTIDQIPF